MAFSAGSSRPPLARPWIAATVSLAILAVASLCIGLTTYGPGQAWAALTAFNGSPAHHVIRDLRLPRTLTAPTVGAALAVAGVLVQTLTRNRIAAPDILGLNAAAALAVVIFVSLVGGTALVLVSGAAVAGALAAAVVIYLISAAHGPMSPARTVLAGITLTALLGSLTQVILTTEEAALETLLFWLAGAFADRPLDLLWTNAGLLAAGFAAALVLAPSLDVLATDDRTAAGLGISPARLRAMAFAAVAALTGGAVAVAGPVGFIGLVVPHAARWMVGPGHARLVPFAAVAGAVFGLGADILARLVLFPDEAPVGAITALIGGPVLLWLLRRGLA
ncbi:hypothetical protein C882_3635 [Caenispirillum salinarum AK4]|uniref:ABC-type Fe3+-siderophore transport system, permease component n=1 Tax=Caenispirillum salinarum AK4 TaxID=1238182 RepID=K9HNH4_9PROT|nr:iron ABC transporter permease [Caenispirillum salinarum]EKV31883.1 hypothetical protein C882_3635 [Caenispirillum salinarum AK4]